MRNHGEVWLANLNPGRGTEPSKVRPVLILQNQALLDAEHPSTLIIPLTTNLVDDAEPLRLRIPARGLLDNDSDLLVDHSAPSTTCASSTGRCCGLMMEPWGGCIRLLRRFWEWNRFDFI